MEDWALHLLQSSIHPIFHLSNLLRFLRKLPARFFFRKRQVISRCADDIAQVGIDRVPGNSIEQCLRIILEARVHVADLRDLFQIVRVDRGVFRYEGARQQQSDLATQSVPICGR
jgi:hypothetical protein